MQRRFHQLDVFSAVPLKGNPLAVVHVAEGLSDDTMAAFARWTNLSETTFLLPPQHAAASQAWQLPSVGWPAKGNSPLGVKMRTR